MASVTAGEAAAAIGIPAAVWADVSTDAETPPSACEGAGELMRVALLKKALTHSREGRMATLCCEPACRRRTPEEKGKRERRAKRTGSPMPVARALGLPAVGLPVRWHRTAASSRRSPDALFQQSHCTCQHDASRRCARRVGVRL